jgi:membrane protease YdiL (CAAX protease family)
VTTDASPCRPSAGSSLLALALLAPVPTVGVVAAMFAAPGTVGQGVFVAAKLWIVVFPAFWYLAVEKGRPSWSPPRHGGLGAGAAIGLVMAAVILVAYFLVLGHRLDPLLLRTTAAEMDLARPGVYLAGAAYWILVNSLIEEYVYRWFVLRQLRALVPDVAAILGSALIFTVHHTVAMADYLSPAHNALGTAAVFAAGAIWCRLYLRYRSVWPPWVAHVIADVPIFLIGWQILFG